MEDWKHSILAAKNIYDQFLSLMDYYDLLTDNQKKAWKRSIHPEKYISEPKMTPHEERDMKIQNLKE